MSDKPLPNLPHELIGTVWQHRKTTGLYTVIGVCLIVARLAPAVLYRHTNYPSAPTWRRPVAEFCDGRFERKM